MRKVTHPDRLYIQINDEKPDTLGFSFNDSPDNPEGIDPNAFDQATLYRVTQMLANVFCCMERLRKTGEHIKSID